MHLIHAVVFSSDLWDVKRWNEEEKQEAGEKKFLTRPVQCFADPIHFVRELVIFISGEVFYWKVSSLYLANRSVQYVVLVRGRCYAGKAGTPMKLVHVGLVAPSTSDPLPWGCLFTDLPVFSILLSFFFFLDVGLSLPFLHIPQLVFPNSAFTVSPRPNFFSPPCILDTERLSGPLVCPLTPCTPPLDGELHCHQGARVRHTAGTASC